MKTPLWAALSVFWTSAAAAQMDLVEQHVSIDLTGATPKVELDAWIEAQGPLYQIDLFTPPAPISRSWVDGSTVTPRRHPQAPGQALQIVLPVPAGPGDRIRIQLAFEGAIDCRYPGQPGLMRCVSRPDQTVLLPPEPGLGWYLINLWSADPFDGSLAVRVPDDHLAATSAGEPPEVTDLADGTWRWTFPLQRVESIPLIAGAWERIEREAPSAAAGYYYRGTGEPRRLQDAVAIAAELIPYYQRIYPPQAIPEAQIVSVPPFFPFGAIGLFGTTLVGEYVFDEYDYLLEQGMAHELAHTWWGNAASASDPVEAPFLHEAMAEHSAWRALGQLRGAAARTGGVRMNATWYLLRRPEGEDVAILDPAGQRSPAFIFAAYHKGCAVMRTLETQAGAEAFDRALFNLASLGPGGLTVAALGDALSRETGRDFGPLLRPWLEEVGAPALRAGRAPSGALWVESSGPWSFTLPIRVTAAGGEIREERLEIREGRAELALAPDDRVAIDPEWATLRTVTPEIAGDVDFDGRVDAFDLLAIAPHLGTYLPETRRQDGGYDPLFDLDRDLRVDVADLERVLAP
jgi:hypothetical protein